MLCAAILFIAAQSLFAQSYTHSPSDSIVANAVYNDINVYNIIQNHTTNDTLVFKWEKHFVNLPATWEASVCDVGHCYATIVDSSTTEPIMPGDNGLISLHLNPQFQAGTGIVQVLFWEAKTPLQVDTLTWVITAGDATAINAIDKNNLISVYPNPAVNFISITTPFENGFEYVVFDNTGKMICRNTSKGKLEQLNTTLLPNGNYSIQLMQNKTIFERKFIVQH